MSLDTQRSINDYEKSGNYFKIDKDGQLVSLESYFNTSEEIQRLHADGYLNVDDMKIYCTEYTSYGPSDMYGEQDTESKIYFSSSETNYSHDTLEPVIEDVFEVLQIRVEERAKEIKDDLQYNGDGFPRPYYSNLGAVNPNSPDEVALYEGRTPIGTVIYYKENASLNKITFIKAIIDDYSPVLGEYYYTTVGCGHFSAYYNKYIYSDSSDKRDTRNFITAEVMEREKGYAIETGRLYEFPQ